MKLKKKSRIGIWGYGLVGKAVANYFYNQGHCVNIMDKRPFTSDEIQHLQRQQHVLYNETDKNNFFISHDYLFSSPGVNIGLDYPTHKCKWLNELDIFASEFNKPIIAVTGSIGKTSVTHMIADLLTLANIKACVGGNIGIPTFDLLAQKKSVSCALLELSSFQLQYCQTFAPQLAIWTNFYPNHLDHHATQEEYLLAKYAIMTQQKKDQNALLHLSLRDKIPQNQQNTARSYFSAQEPEDSLLIQLHDAEKIYFLKNNIVMRYWRNEVLPIVELNKELAAFSFLENIILLAAVTDLLSIDPHLLYRIPHITQLPKHRLEKCFTYNNVDFYNDSKSTTTASTLAAVHKLKNRRLHLFLGGLSKGVDRAPFIAQLAPFVHQIYCFGREASELHAIALKNNMHSNAFDNLETAVVTCLKNIQPNDTVLFSPAGSSYDLYTDYQERGTHFKQLIKK